jgi:hypothetical protein
MRPGQLRTHLAVWNEETGLAGLPDSFGEVNTGLNATREGYLYGRVETVNAAELFGDSGIYSEVSTILTVRKPDADELLLELSSELRDEDLGVSYDVKGILPTERGDQYRLLCETRSLDGLEHG